MFQVDFAPDVMCQLERVMLQKLDYGGRQEAGRFLHAFETCIDSKGSGNYMNGIPKKYRVKSVVPQLFLVYQIDEEAACVRIDSLVEISN